jgi:HEAT repeat protein
MKLPIHLSARPRSWVPFFLLLVLAVHTPALLAQTPQQRAWEILRKGANEKSTGKRVQAVRALRLLPGDSEATEMAERALLDRKHEVRAAAATALGLMGSKVSIPELKQALTDKDPSVVLTAAHALQVLNDRPVTRFITSCSPASAGLRAALWPKRWKR